MTHKPAIGDRVVFFYGCEHGEESGKIIAKRESAWGVSWEVLVDDSAKIQYFDRYAGTAEDRGGYYVQREPNGIGTYLVC